MQALCSGVIVSLTALVIVKNTNPPLNLLH
jgi:hypothetical protein